ncbi:DUF6069 family protein [Nocardiopsis kunsanensis]|uniref:Uncharacterized protein n=1 Tax=Nocardiopsis kunsanensis TaxID=141693 RepID=A0A918XG28_9ACTN|nr:DUF6069 family protein [Nocardiopsis kunsanensis]GHD30755.1 hypothetical protein GCM10007147_32780 [Nocardiopsis kunsanensis]
MSEIGSERAVNVSRLWSGGLATAVVAILVIFAGALVFRGVFDVPVLAPEEAGYLGDTSTALYALLAGVIALVATALLQMLLLSAPRALTFFGWIMGLAIAIAAVTPFSQAAETSSQAATAVINLVSGIVIVALLRSVGRTAFTPQAPTTPEKSPTLLGPNAPSNPEGYPNQASTGPALQQEGVLPDVSQEEYRKAETRARRQDAEEERAKEGPLHE